VKKQFEPDQSLTLPNRSGKPVASTPAELKVGLCTLKLAHQHHEWTEYVVLLH